jgi:glycosyltransferase involved in cell wall biosynthesis
MYMKEHHREDTSGPDAGRADRPGQMNSETGSLDVLIISQPVEGGVAVCVRQLTEAAVAAGHRVKIACPPSSEGPLATWVEKVGADHEPLYLVRSPSVRDLGSLFAIRKLARGRDVVHLHSSKAGALGRIAIATLGRKRPATVFTPHAWSWLTGSRLVWLYRLIERRLAKRGDVIVAVSEQEAQMGRAVLGRAARNLIVIPNGVDRSHFSPEGERAERDETAPLILCVGRLSDQKGQDVALRALAGLEHQNARLRLVGEGPTRDELEALAGALGVRDRVEFRGLVSDTAPEFRSADVVIAPSRWEGMSLVFLEAMASGATIVVSDVAGSEVVAGAGVVVPREDPDALARAIDQLLSDPQRRKRLGAAARRASKSYDLDTTLERNLDLWSTLAHRRTGRNPAVF